MRISHHTQLTSAEKSPWCRRSRVSPDLVEYGTSWSPRCRAITVTWSEISVRAVKGQSARSQRHSMLCCRGPVQPLSLPLTLALGCTRSQAQGSCIAGNSTEDPGQQMCQGWGCGGTACDRVRNAGPGTCGAEPGG